jgi:hypothetical protein
VPVQSKRNFAHFFNSSIQTGGNTRNPNLLNNTGLDIGVFNIPNSGNSVITNNQTVTNCATKLETESSVQLISVLSTTGFTVCDKTILTGLGGLRNILP